MQQGSLNAATLPLPAISERFRPRAQVAAQDDERACSPSDYVRDLLREISKRDPTKKVISR